MDKNIEFLKQSNRYKHHTAHGRDINTRSCCMALLFYRNK